jgi:hypothetical protein
MKIRITIEYDTDGNSVEEEEQDWCNDAVTMQDLFTLQAQGDTGITIKFEQLSDVNH